MDAYICPKCGKDYAADCGGVRYDLENTGKVMCSKCNTEMKFVKGEENQKNIK